MSADAIDEILDRANRLQREAADPRASAWVTASAGSGKTKVLADRMLTLLLAGVLPPRLLCLTFTKAAAAEMANRILGLLAEYATVGEDALVEKLAKLLGRDADAAERARARRLFAEVLETPGGLKVMTVHAFCQSVLRRFPLEAGIAPHFEAMDERDAAEALDAAKLATLARARDGGAPGLAAALATVTRHVAEDRFDKLMQALTAERARLARMLAAGEPAARLAAALGVAPDATPERVVAAAVADGAFDRADLARAAAALRQGGDKDRERGDAVARWLDRDAAGRAASFADYRGAFLTAKLEPLAKVATKAALAAWPDAERVLRAEQERLVAVQETLRKATLLEASAALATLGAALLATYERGKAARGRLDYDDLILKTGALLARPGIAAWVLFKLDGGLDHVLIDEGQDTNPEQWRAVAALAEEFFVGRTAGDEARPVPRTIFAVGDAKQSIYSFQRADPAAFEAMRRHFKTRVEDANRDFREVPLDVSFRSTRAVLDAVDAVFARDEAKAGVVAADEVLHHYARRGDEAGLVELWPAVEPRPVPEPTPWKPPVERVAGDEPSRGLAQAIAGRVRGWLDRGERLTSQGREVVPGDVMVLVRRRGPFVPQLVRALKDRGVPVAGVDRMVLTDQLAVADLVALGRFLLMPEDDLTLATVLKGPLVAFDEEALFALAWRRPGTLWQALGERAGASEAFAQAHAFLAGLLTRVDFVRPYELFAELLHGGGQARMLARLGPDAEDPLDEFLSLALAYERVNTPSLQGFLHWLAAGKAEIKRDLDRGGDTVRVMTVHGAKGLQAPIVFLPDTLGVPMAPDPPLLWLEDPDLLLWPPHRADQDSVAAAAYAAKLVARDDEYRRLLYVAMTRAADRLYVCGWRTKRTPAAGTWYHLVEAALRPLAQRLPAPEFGEGAELLRLETEQRRRPEPPKAVAAAAIPPLPAWARRAVPPEAPPPRPFAPSRPGGEEPPPVSPLGPDDGYRFRRGRIIHKLLQILPELPPRRRAPALRRFLAAPTQGLDAARQAEIAAAVTGVLKTRQLAPLFGPGSLAEAPLAGIVESAAGPILVSGQVDRLLIDRAEVVVIDYKTNRPAPASEAEVARAYLRQMAAYAALLRRIYPDKSVRCALLWTDGPRLMWLDPQRLEALAPGLGES